jgi:hypothetical protein
MLVSGNSYYIDVGKTGTSFVEDILQSTVGCHNGRGRHTGLEKVPDFNTTLVFASVRNPFAYWPSHMAYSRADSNLERYLTNINVKHGDLKNGPHGNERFHSWRNFPKTLGMLTFHYLIMLDKHFLTESRTEAEVYDWFDRHYFNDHPNCLMIGGTNLKQELFDLLLTRREMFPSTPDLEEKIKKIDSEYILSRKSAHKVFDRDYKSFHNERTIEIIKTTEKILVDKFGFTVDNITRAI